MATSSRPTACEFAGGETIYNGALSDSATLRDYNPRSFLTNLIWNTRGERQCFQFGPADNQDIAAFIAARPECADLGHLRRLGGAAVPVEPQFRRNPRRSRPAAKDRSRLLAMLRAPEVKARVRIWTLAEFVENPMEPLQTIVDEISPRAMRRLTEVPRMADLTGLWPVPAEPAQSGHAAGPDGRFPGRAGLTRTSSQPPRPALSGEVIPWRRRFTAFVMFAEMRTGSNFLEANLNALPGVICHGEVFNPHFIGKKDQTELFGIDLAARDRDPRLLLRRLRDRRRGPAGLSLFPRPRPARAGRRCWPTRPAPRSS